jgi:hypothetical protein
MSNTSISRHGPVSPNKKVVRSVEQEFPKRIANASQFPMIVEYQTKFTHAHSHDEMTSIETHDEG